MRRLSIILSYFCIFSVSAYAADHIDLVRKGNEAFKKGDYKGALEYYHSAETDLPESPELEYNMAGALHQDGGYEQAVEKYRKALTTK
ncbi:MAG: tetratricopeptide repeat protein, partial [Candidatus Zixiibacteriota bacterium]